MNVNGEHHTTDCAIHFMTILVCVCVCVCLEDKLKITSFNHMPKYRNVSKFKFYNRIFE